MIGVRRHVDERVAALGFVAGELALWAALYGAYLGLRAVAIAEEGRAFANARQVIDAEGALGLAHEGVVQRALEPAEPVLSLYYMLGFAPLVIGALLWLAWRRRDLYRSLRTALLSSIALAGVVHLLYPVAPPRLVGGLGIADWVGLSGGHDTGSFAGIRFNPYAAMPSMHVGWSLLVGVMAWSALPGRWRVLGLVHPAMMAVAVTATGNHYLLDAVGGVAAALAGLAVARLLGRERGVVDRIGSRARSRGLAGVVARSHLAGVDREPGQARTLLVLAQCVGHGELAEEHPHVRLHGVDREADLLADALVRGRGAAAGDEDRPAEGHEDAPLQLGQRPRQVERAARDGALGLAAGR